LDTLIFVSEHSTAAWAALSAALSGIGAWLLGLRRIAASGERARIKLIADAAASEVVERAAFRSTLMTEVSSMRLLIKECEGDRNLLRDRLNTTEAQVLVIKASNEIMERWMAFFKARNEWQPSSTPGDVKFQGPAPAAC